MSEFWVFGYGSLMWRPGFPFEESVPAHLVGAHRALCVYSWVHRGTRELPGLVLGLDHGGSCRGVAYRVDSRSESDVVAYLREREQVTSVYRETRRAIRLDRPGRPAVAALTYMVDRRHPQYAGTLERDAILAHVRAGHGVSGANVDYVINTMRHLRELKFRDATLEWVTAVLEDETMATPACRPSAGPAIRSA